MKYLLSLTIEGSVSAIPFILANGKEWIFGVVSIEPGGKKQCLHTAVLTFDGKHITLMTALYVWVSISHKMLPAGTNMLSL